MNFRDLAIALEVFDIDRLDCDQRSYMCSDVDELSYGMSVDRFVFGQTMDVICRENIKKRFVVRKPEKRKFKNKVIAVDLGGSSLKMCFWMRENGEFHVKETVIKQLDDFYDLTASEFIDKEIKWFLLGLGVTMEECDYTLSFSYRFETITDDTIKVMCFSKKWQFSKLNPLLTFKTPFCCILNDVTALMISAYKDNSINLAFISGTGFNAAISTGEEIFVTEMGQETVSDISVDEILGGMSTYKNTGCNMPVAKDDPISEIRIIIKRRLLTFLIKYFIDLYRDDGRRINIVLNGTCFIKHPTIIEEVRNECDISKVEDATISFFKNISI